MSNLYFFQNEDIEKILTYIKDYDLKYSFVEIDFEDVIDDIKYIFKYIFDISELNEDLALDMVLKILDYMNNKKFNIIVFAEYLKLLKFLNYPFIENIEGYNIYEVLFDSDPKLIYEKIQEIKLNKLIWGSDINNLNINDVILFLVWKLEIWIINSSEPNINVINKTKKDLLDELEYKKIRAMWYKDFIEILEILQKKWHQLKLPPRNSPGDHFKYYLNWVMVIIPAHDDMPYPTKFAIFRNIFKWYQKKFNN